MPDSVAFNSLVGNGFRIPELKGGSKASADNVSKEALYVIARLGGGKGSPE